MGTVDTSPGGYRIAELAGLSGFSPATLRYYEKVGVLAEPERTPAGYRKYVDRDLDRLRLIARAKDLGCTLDEIADLVRAWEDDDCGPVRHRLRSLVHKKVQAVQTHLAEQASFAAQLQATAAALAGRPVDGPCDDSCGCTTASTEPVTADVGEGVTATQAAGTADGVDGETHGCGCATAQDPAPARFGRSSDPDGPDLPIACSLSADDMGTRLEDWQEVLAAVQGRERRSQGIRLEFGHDAPLGELVRLSAAEQACCPFFGFAITVDHRGVGLEVTAPEDGQAVLAAVFGAAA